MNKKNRSGSLDIILNDCIICLDNKHIHMWCKYCYICSICLRCHTKLCKTNNASVCPCCRQRNWYIKIRPKTHPPLTPNNSLIIVPQTITVNLNNDQVTTNQTIRPNIRNLFICSTGQPIEPETITSSNSINTSYLHSINSINIIIPSTTVYRDNRVVNQSSIGKSFITFLFIMLFQLMFAFSLGSFVCLIIINNPTLNIGLSIIYGLFIEFGLLFTLRLFIKIKQEYNNNNLSSCLCLPCNHFIQSLELQADLYHNQRISNNL